MSEKTSTTRRTLLKGIGASLAVGGFSGLSAAAESKWTTAKTGTDSSLYDVEYTSAGAYAVGAGGVVLERGSTRWTKIVDGGPTGNGNSLYGSDVTDDGDTLWFVGASGAIGEYAVGTGNLNDHSAPMDNTNNYNDVAVTGETGAANVYVAGDSGKIYYSFENGETGTWNYVTPGSGSAIQAIDFHGPRSGHAVDSNGRVFATDDGVTWNVVGLQDANVNFYGVDSDGDGEVTVVGGGGMVFHLAESQWVAASTGDKSLLDVEVEDGDGYVVGGGGTVYSVDTTAARFDENAGPWTAEATPVGQNLKAVVRGQQGGPDITVGSGGTVLEK
jgi:hypothetical protein